MERGCSWKPGVESMLGHAPPPLTANGLDMRDGHPAGIRCPHHQSSFPRLAMRAWVPRIGMAVDDGDAGQGALLGYPFPTPDLDPA